MAGLCSGYSCGRLRMSAGQPTPSVPDEDHPDKLSLALEPESAAFFCQRMSEQQLASYAKANHPFTSNSYLVIDIGGGTVDISALSVSEVSSAHIKLVLPPAGNDCGGTRVNKEFASFLEELVHDPGFCKYLTTHDAVTNAVHNARLNELINNTFEVQKRIFSDKGGKGEKVSVRLPYSFLETYKERIKSGIQKLKDPRVELCGTDLRFAFTKLEDFYRPVMDGILTCITETLESIDGKIELFYVVGGFGGCHYIFNAIAERFGDAYKYITPMEPDLAVVRGAVLFRKKLDTVESRRADATYGVSANIPFIEGLHEEAYKKTDKDGAVQCTNIFSTFVECGDLVDSNEVLVTSYTPEDPEQSCMHIDIYTSPEKDVWYNTGKRPHHSKTTSPAVVFKVGELTIPLPPVQNRSAHGTETCEADRQIEVTFDFSHTEVQVKARDKATDSEVKVVIDFLSS